MNCAYTSNEIITLTSCIKRILLVKVDKYFPTHLWRARKSIVILTACIVCSKLTSFFIMLFTKKFGPISYSEISSGHGCTKQKQCCIIVTLDRARGSVLVICADSYGIFEFQVQGINGWCPTPIRLAQSDSSGAFLKEALGHQIDIVLFLHLAFHCLKEVSAFLCMWEKVERYGKWMPMSQSTTTLGISI